MSQDFMQQESLAGGGGNTAPGGFATGTKCTSSGTFRASNKYMDSVIVVAAGEVFPPFLDGRKTTWYPLTSTLSSNKSGSFESVKVAAGTL